MMLKGNKCRINLLYGEAQKELQCDQGSILMDVLNKNNIYIDAPCGGNCLCGKCKVKVIGENVSLPAQEELKLITQKEKNEGYRLACTVQILGDVEIILEDNRDSAQIMSGGIDRTVSVSPAIRKKVVVLDKPAIQDQRDDLQRLLDALDLECRQIPLKILQKLPDLIRDHNCTVTVVYNDKEIISVEGGDTSHLCYGVAVDIGTTTVVTYLVDLNSGKQVDVISELNSQKSFGGDVISRISHTLQQVDGLRQLQEKIVSQINCMIQGIANKNKIDVEHIYSIVLVGNTTMMHLFSGVPPKNIAASPFTPAFTQNMVYHAKDLGLKINDTCLVYLLCCISGYVGADIVAAISASGMMEKDELSLLIDIGTNGEIVLGNKDHITCCSTAAGPAFEGAHIRNGVGGIAGAINTVKLENNQIKYTTISNGNPLGICGSGIVDIVSMLIETGIVDETGRIVDEDEVESELGRALIKNVIELDGMPAFVIAQDTETKNGEPIVITQKDIREVQLAKAAIAAGINTLIKTMGKKVEDISNIYLAGGFGSYIDKKSAVRIGLLPGELENKITVLGNAAGMGAVMALLSEQYYFYSDEIKRLATYVELSTTPEFQDEYVNCMYF